jgi:SPOR domain
METRLHTNRPEPKLPPAEEAWPIEASGQSLYGETPPPGGFGAILRPLIYGVVGLCCAGALWYAYQHSRLAPTRAADVPLIRADPSAAKVRPDQPGGEPVPDQDKLVYNPSQVAPKIERLLPPPEQPLAKPVPPAEAQDTGASAPLPVQTIAPVAEPRSAPQTPPSATLPSAILPAASSSGVLFAPIATPPPVGDTLPEATPTSLPPDSSSSASGGSKLSRPTQLKGPSTPSAPAAAAPKDAPVVVTAAKIPNAAAKLADAGSYRIQIGASRDEAQARAEGDKLQKAHPDLLGQLTPIVVKADLGDKGIYYRVQAGPVADHDKAEKLCQALKQFAIACLIVKP